jgi:hypothetical protein
MDLFKNHKKSFFLSVIFYLWWFFILFYSIGITNRIDLNVGVSAFAFALISITWCTFYVIGFTIKSINSKEPDKTDYLIFLGINILPLLIGGVYVMSNS